MKGPSTPPTPAQLGMRLATRCVTVVAAEVLLAIAIAAEHPTGSFPRAFELGLGVAAAATLAAAVSIVDLIRNTRSLYKTATRSVGSVLPPSEAALRDVHGAPWRVAATVGGSQVLVLLVDWAWEPSGSENRFLVLGFSVLGVTPLTLLVERAFDPWLRPFRAEDVRAVRVESGLWQFGLRSGLPVMGVALVATTLVWPDSIAGSWWRSVGNLGWSLGIGWVAGIFALRAEREYDREAGVLARRIETRTVEGAPVSFRTLQSLRDALVALESRARDTAKAEERALEVMTELQKRKMMFMASMSHDLRNPLNSIMGFTELLASETAGQLTSGQRENVNAIELSGSELLHLLDDVLDSARLGAGRLPIERRWTPSVEILTEAMRRVRNLIASRDLDIHAELQPGLPPVYADRDRIVQAVVGIFRHAVRTMKSGTIQLRASVAQDGQGETQVRVVIADRSAGIRSEDRERLFQAFREVAEPSGRRIGGLGLALSLSRQLLCAHGGDIWAESEEGRGTTFTVALPTRETV